MTHDRDFSRQCFLGIRSERTLESTRAAIVGLGGGGSHIAQQLAHLGVGHYSLLDPQRIDASNLNRLVGATAEDIRLETAKVEIADRVVRGIRPWANVRIAQSSWQEADHLFKDAHVIFGCVDGYAQRDFLEGFARRYYIPYIDIGMTVTEIAPSEYAISGQMIRTLPGGPCLRCLGFLSDERLNEEEDRYGDAGTVPQVVWANGILASLAIGEFVKLVTPWHSQHDSSAVWLELDGNSQTVSRSARLKHMPTFSSCPHHGGPDGIGDPLFDIRA